MAEFRNPFLQSTPPDPLRLTVREELALARAPRKWPDTTVTVRAYPVRQVGGVADHMYIEYDDGRQQLIARGGPSTADADTPLGILSGDARVSGGVYPAHLSRDYGRGKRVLYRDFLPDVTAREAAEAARLHALGVNRGGNAYGAQRNSNSFAADVTEDTFGRRVGDRRTWGYEHS